MTRRGHYRLRLPNGRSAITGSTPARSAQSAHERASRTEGEKSMTTGAPGKSIELEFTADRECFVRFDGLRIAKRGGGRWTALVPGYRVHSPPDHGTVAVEVLPLSGSVN
jgi:hypothetical protein